MKDCFDNKTFKYFVWFYEKIVNLVCYRFSKITLYLVYVLSQGWYSSHDLVPIKKIVFIINKTVMFLITALEDTWVYNNFVSGINFM